MAGAVGKPEDRSVGIDMGELPDLIGFNLRCAQVSTFQHFSKTVGEAEISPPQYGALVLIEANPGISQSAIASALRFDRSTLVQIIDRLEERGLVVREVSANDRRSHALKVTPSGETALKDLKRRVRDHEAHITRELSEDEKHSLIALLARLHQTPFAD
jgi:DNA-binding MarR family transcriptional regulator